MPPQFRHVGAEVPMQNDRGETRTFFVTRIEDGKLTVDCNHPFAGKTLIFAVTITDIRAGDRRRDAQGRVRNTRAALTGGSGGGAARARGF